MTGHQSSCSRSDPTGKQIVGASAAKSWRTGTNGFGALWGCQPVGPFPEYHGVTHVGHASFSGQYNGPPIEL
ncbi:hypothetical protein CCUG63695_00606 [Mycobacteroides franklinii]|uniref:Uncharacterized protein n=1 Tax=Mycobacteroides franklinii TaxID=948102 RepID=A0A4R8QZ72_9MYCO|nr:hypothetical protein CCUG64054_01240 [Mycobacteroides franklinii]TDZ49085.1 hypothetical protein CCUG63697_03617 [Mycobacteroides franklinii]TDZ59266.1 hypothetical protein CCUG63696_01244 [Mycobacteroides franklinii]TDZ66780.1 hypothetical protein CCUG63695_00606 [Mycobacteroides franklinii]TDZ72703.1 hypothetical protein CCUG64056_01240 [Mycobacteroides franklinii]